jgi:hypothetical protein
MSSYITDKVLKMADWITAEQEKMNQARREANFRDPADEGRAGG